MRIDKFLKVSRIIKRRTIAQEACDAGRVTINEKQAKPGAEVKIGDIIEVRFGENRMKARVLLVADHVPKGDVSLLYEVVTE